MGDAIMAVRGNLQINKPREFDSVILSKVPHWLLSLMVIGVIILRPFSIAGGASNSCKPEWSPLSINQKAAKMSKVSSARATASNME